MSIFVDYRDLCHRVNTKSNIFTSDEVTSGNIYFLCSRVEIKSIINKNRQFFFLFYAKIAVLRCKIRCGTKNGAKNDTTVKVKRTASRAFGTCDVHARFNNNVEAGNQILIISTEAY